jgi:hypothetical protein
MLSVKVARALLTRLERASNASVEFGPMRIRWNIVGVVWHNTSGRDIERITSLASYHRFYAQAIL